jgi:hypothetical protein
MSFIGFSNIISSKDDKLNNSIIDIIDKQHIIELLKHLPTEKQFTELITSINDISLAIDNLNVQIKKIK